MAGSSNTATTTGQQTSSNGTSRRLGLGNGNGTSNGNGDARPQSSGTSHLRSQLSLTQLEPLAAYRLKKYRHVAATHSKPRTTCLSHDAENMPSFLGFRNLMILVLVVSNLRLMLTNIQKVCSSEWTLLAD